jgi:hypothetical protein
MIPVIIELPNDIDKCGASCKVIYTSTPLIMIVKSPSVSKIAGKETITNSGFRSVLANEKINPANTNPQKPAVATSS